MILRNPAAIQHNGRNLFAHGNPALLHLPLEALLCSKACPGAKIIEAMDLAQRWRAENRAVISGFHTAVEKECLRIFLRGPQPIVICPARGLDPFLLPGDWRPKFERGELLILSPFHSATRRPTKETAETRTRLVLSLAQHHTIIHATPRGLIDRLTEQRLVWFRRERAERILKEIEALSRSERKLLVERLRLLRSKEIPQDFIDALDDFQKGRFVSMETALNETPPNAWAIIIERSKNSGGSPLMLPSKTSEAWTTRWPVDPRSAVELKHPQRRWSPSSPLRKLQLLAGRSSGRVAVMKEQVISRDPGILGGTPVFTGTRVPVRNLLDCLEGGYSIGEFLEDFPTVRREQAIAVLEEASARLELASPVWRSCSTSVCPNGLAANWPDMTVTVPMIDLAGIENGELLRCLAGRCDASVTIDANLVYQQNLSGLPFAVIVLKAATNKLEDLRPLIGAVLATLAHIQPGEIRKIAG